MKKTFLSSVVQAAAEAEAKLCLEIIHLHLNTIPHTIKAAAAISRNLSRDNNKVNHLSVALFHQSVSLAELEGAKRSPSPSPRHQNRNQNHIQNRLHPVHIRSVEVARGISVGAVDDISAVVVVDDTI